MSETDKLLLVAPEVRAMLTESNQSFLDAVTRVMNDATVSKKVITSGNHEATIQRDNTTDVVSVDIKPAKCFEGQQLSIAAQYSYKELDVAGFDASATSLQSLAALDNDGDGTHEIGSFHYKYHKSHVPDKQHETMALIENPDDDDTVNTIVIEQNDTIDTVGNIRLPGSWVRSLDIQTLRDTNADGITDKIQGIYGVELFDNKENRYVIDLPERFFGSSRDTTPIPAISSAMDDIDDGPNSFVALPSENLQEAFLRNGGPKTWISRSKMRNDKTD